MNNDQRILEEIEKTLRTLDDDGRLTANPFLYARLKALRQSQSAAHRFRPALRLGLQIAAMLLLLGVNLATVLSLRKTHAVDVRDQVVAELKAELQVEQSQSNF